MEKIKAIILNKKLSYVERLVKVYQEIDKDLRPLADALDIPLDLMVDITDPIEPPAKAEPKQKPFVHQLINEFSKKYTDIFGKRFIWINKEIGGISNISKKILTVEEFNRVLSFVELKHNEKKKKAKLDNWHLNTLVENICPTMIYSKLNVIMASISETDGKKWKWEK